jgi:ribonuclease D
MNIQQCQDDLPFEWDGVSVAIDTETMGLNTLRDRLCLVQLCSNNSRPYLVQVKKDPLPAPRMKAMLQNPNVLKIFHFARFDMATLYHCFGVMPNPVYCTKIASKIARTYTDRHGLKELCREMLSTEISKYEQTSDWGRDHLTDEQKKYAAKDVLYLHSLKERLDGLLEREGRRELAKACFSFLPTRVMLDLRGWPDDIFQH